MSSSNKPKLLSDENIPIKVTRLLKEKGFDIVDASLNSTDKKISKTAKSESRVILTFDKHFLNKRLFSPKEHHGIIFIDTFRAGGTDVNDTVRNLTQRVFDYLLSSPYDNLIADPIQFESVDGVTMAEQKVLFLSGGFRQLNDSRYDGFSVDDFYSAMGLAGVLVS